MSLSERAVRHSCNPSTKLRTGKGNEDKIVGCGFAGLPGRTNACTRWRCAHFYLNFEFVSDFVIRVSYFPFEDLFEWASGMAGLFCTIA